MARGRLKGITIEIGGDATPLNRALTETNKKAKGLQSELRGVETLLKMDPGNVDLIRQKQQLLSEAVGETKSKLETLKRAKAEADRQMAAGAEVNQEGYRDLVREIAATENRLESLTREAREFGGVATQQLRRVGDGFQDAGQKMKGLGGSMTAMVTAPMAAGLVAVTEGTKEFREDLSKLEVNAKQAGASVEQTKDRLRDLEAVTGETDSNVEALSNLLQAGFTGGGLDQAVEALSGAVIKFPDTLKIEGLADGLQETLATGAAVGPFGELLERLGMDLDTFNAGLEQAVKNGDQENYILKTLADTGIADVNKAWLEANGTMADASKAQYDLRESLAELGNTLQPIITRVVELINGLLQKFNNLSPAGQKIVLVIAGLAAAIGPLLMVIGQASIGVGAIIKLLPALKTGIAAVNTVLNKNPILLIVSLIAMLIGFFVRLYQTNEEFREKVDAVWAAVKSIFSTVINAIKNKVQGFIDKIKGIVAVFTEVKQKLEEKVKDFFNIGKNILEGIWNGILSVKEKVFGAIGGVVDSIKGFFTGKKGFDTNSPSRWAKGVMQNVMAGLEKGTGLGSGALKKFQGVSDEIMTALTPKEMQIGIHAMAANAAGAVRGPGFKKSAAEGIKLEHTGTIRIEGINDQKQLVGAVDLLAEDLFRLARQQRRNR